MPTGINNVGQIVGLSSTGLILDTNGAITNVAIPTFGGIPGYIGDRLAKINDLGQIVGNYSAQFETRAFLYANGATTLLPVGIDETVSAHGINNAGQIVVTISGAGLPGTCLYQNGQYLPIAPSGVDYAVGINNDGEIVTANPPGVHIYNLSGVSLGGFEFYTPDMTYSGLAFDVNDAGQIVGGDLLARPVPELAALLLFTGGLSGLMAITRRKRIRVTSFRHSFRCAAMRVLLCFVFGLLGGISPAAADMLYTVTGLGPVVSYGINNAGQVTGFGKFSTAGLPHAFLYTNGQITDITAPQVGPAYLSSGAAVNNAGQVTGFAELTAGSSIGQYAFLYSNGQVTNLGALPGVVVNGYHFYSEGYGINNAGQVTGDAESVTGTRHAFLYSNGQMTDLGPGTGYGINNAGQITGVDANLHAFLYSNGQKTDLGFGVGYAINEAGQVTGGTVLGARAFFKADPTAGGRVFLYSNGQRIDLGPGVGIAINNAGQVVGAAYASPGDEVPSAFLYMNGQMYNLNDLIYPSPFHGFLEQAIAINDQGQIVVNGIVSGSGFGTYLLTPVPEPSYWLPCAVVLLGLSAWVRHKQS